MEFILGTAQIDYFRYLFKCLCGTAVHSTDYLKRMFFMCCCIFKMVFPEQPNLLCWSLEATTNKCPTSGKILKVIMPLVQFVGFNLHPFHKMLVRNMILSVSPCKSRKPHIRNTVYVLVVCHAQALHHCI